MILFFFLGASDIYQGNLKLILGLVWALILRYQIAGPAPTDPNSASPESKEAKKKRINAKKLLLDWVNATIPSKKAGNFTTDWNDGVRLSALVNYCKPGIISDHASLDPSNGLSNVSHAMDVAEKELGVPKVMSPEDLAVEKPDELSVMTYVSGFCRPDSAGLNSLLEWVNSKIPNQPVSNFTTDWADGRALAALVDSLTQGEFPEFDRMKEGDDRLKNCQEAMDAAERLLGIKKTTSPEEFSENEMDHLTRSTYITQFRSAEPSTKDSIASTLKAMGPGITGDSAEKETNFVVRGPRIPQWAKIDVSVKSPSGSEVPLREQSTSSRASQFHYTPETPGDYVIEIALNGEPIPGSPFNVTHIPPTNVEGCVATGSGLSKARVGETTGFSVNCEQGGPGELQVDIESPNGNLTPEIDEAREKHYDVSFTPSEAGDHVVNVQWDSKSIPSSPFTCVVTDPKKCAVTGSGLSRGYLGDSMTFSVKTNKAGPGELSVDVDGPNGSVPVEVKDAGGGVFEVTYVPKDTGSHTVSALWSNGPIPGSPFAVSVLAPADASKCAVSNLPEGRLQAKHTYSFDVNAANAGSGKMKVWAHGPTVPEACTVKDNGSGLHTVDFTPAEVGPLKVDVTYGDDPIPKSPFQFTVNDPTKVKVNRAAIENATYLVKQPLQFVVSAAHAGEGDIDASIRNPNGEEKLEVKDKGGRSYLLSYSPKEGGSHAINITFDGRKIPDVPVRIFVDDSNRAEKIVVTQPIPSKIGAYVVNTPYEYKVITADAGLDELVVTSVGAKTGLKPSVRVSQDGSERYSALITAESPDKYSVNIQWGGEHVPGSPFKINIEGQPQPEKVVCKGPHYKIGSSDPVTLEANAENAGAGKLSATCVGDTSGDVPVKISESAPKKYLVSFSPPRDDIYSLSILWELENVSESPFKINLIPPDASKCIVSGPDVPTLPAEPIVLYVDASNAGNGRLATSALGDKTGKKYVDIKETEENKFVLSFVPNLTDFYTWNVKWDEVDVPGAPFRVNSAAANADEVMICEPPTAMLEAGQAIGICFDTSKGGKGSLSAVCKGNNIGLIPISVRKRSMDDYKYDVRFVPPKPDIFVVNVLWSGLDVKGSPFTINLMPVDVSKIKVIGPNMPHGSGGPVDLMLQTAGAGRGKVTGTCFGKDTGTVEVVIKEMSTDIYELCFIPPKPDVYTFDVQYGSQTVNGSPFVINTLPTDASRIKVTEPDSIDVSKLLLYKVDASMAGSGTLNCTCRGEKGTQVPLDVVSEMTGYYNASLTPRQADLYRVSMDWDGKEIPGSPFRVDLRPPMAERVKVGKLHVPDEVGNGEYVWIDLDCLDAGHGPLKGEARGKTAGRMPIEADKMSRTSYRMKFMPSEADIYSFAVAYGDDQVETSPFKINLMPPRPDKVKYVRTALPELEGGPVSLFFDTLEAGKGDMAAVITNASVEAVTKKVEKLSFSEYKVTFIPDVPDLYNASIRWNDVPIEGSPFEVDTRPPLHPELIECGRPIYTDIKLPVNLSVDTSKAGPGRVTAKCRNADKVEIPVQVRKPTTVLEKYDISFVPEVHGKYDLSVYFEGEEIKDSPFSADLNPILERASMVLVEDVESGFISENFTSEPSEKPQELPPSELTAFIGDPFSVDISVADEEKHKKQFRASARGSNSGPTDVDVTKNSDGSFRVFFNPSLPDHYTIDVMMDDKPLPDSPFVVNYIFPVNASKCKIFGLQNIPPVPQVNEPIFFGVDAKEAGNGKLSVSSDGPSQEDSSSTHEVKESDKGEPGVYNITYHPTAMGEHRVHLLWSGDKIPGTPLVFKVGDIHAIQRYPHGKPVSIEINADCKAGDLESYAIHEDTGTKFKVKVSKVKKGKFKFNFQPKQPGIYAIHVLLKKKDTPGSPYRIRYLGPPNPSGITVSDFSGKGYVDHPINFKVNAEQAGTGELGMRVEGPKNIEDSDLTYSHSPQSKELCYDVSYIPRNPGDHFFHITWDKKSVPSSPLKAEVTDLKPEYKTPLIGKGTNIVTVGDPVPVRIVNGGSSINLDTITAQCEGTKFESVDVTIEKTDDKDDQYVIQFVPEIADDYTLSVKVDNGDINGSPFTIKAIEKEKLFPDYSFPSGPQQSDVAAGSPVNVICSAPSIEDPSDLQVTVNGPYGSCPPTVCSDSDGRVGIGFLPPLSGEYVIRAERDGGSSIPGYPCKIRASGRDPDPSKVTVMEKDMAVFQNPIPFGKEARFRISTLDAGPGTLNITSKGPGKAKVKVLDNKNGSYTCEFTPSLAGKYYVDILWNDQHIGGSPYMLHFKTKKNKVIAGLHLEDENFRIDVPHRFKLHCGEVGEGILEINVKPPSAARISLMPLASGNNSYQCEILPKEVGNHEIRAQYNGKHIFGSPFNVQFESQGDASKCHLVESTISGQDTDQEVVDFVISTEGAGRGSLTASIEHTATKSQLPVTVTPNPDNGKLSNVQFSPKEEEEYVLSIKYDNQHIPGSPFKLMFGGDAADASQCKAKGDGIEACIVDKEVSFVVNTLKPNQGELSVSIKGEKVTITPKLSPPGSAKTKVTYVSEKAGNLDLSVKWSNEEIADSPFRVVCYDPSDPSLLMVEKPPTDLLLGNPLKFKVKAALGSPTDGTLTVSCQSASNKSIQGDVERSDDGELYSCTVNSFPGTGKYLVHVRWNGAHVKNSPFKVKVLHPPNPSKVKAYGPGLENGFIGQEGNFTVETEEGGAGTLAVRVHGPKGAFKINMRRHPDNDRTILVRYDPAHVGKYTVDITWSEKHIPGSPFEVNVADQ